MSDAHRGDRGAGAATRRAASTVRAAVSGARRGTAAVGRRVHRITGASGAARTGLSTLIELTAAGSFADAFVAVSLAGTIFFSTSVDQARGRVALFLLVTMAPFAVLAPFIGPALDRMQQGRRYLLAGTLLARGLLCWGMSAAINNPLTLLPAAFGVLVLQKCYGVIRASIAPRLLPGEITLVAANARSALLALIASSIAAPIAAGIDWAAGAAWVLRAGTIVYLASIVLAVRLPEHVDVPTLVDVPAPSGPPGPEPEPGEPGPAHARQRPTRPQRIDDAPGWTRPLGEPSPDGARQTDGARQPGDAWQPGPGQTETGDTGTGPDERRRRFAALRTLGSIGPVVAEAMRGNAVLRAFSGYMIFFLAFLLRTQDFGVSHNIALGAMAAAAAAGGLVAMGIGSVLGSRAPQVLLFGMLVVATAVTAACAWLFGFGSVIIVAFIAALGTGLAKLALDSIVQREISEDVRSSAFAVSETLHQLSWVIGGLLGLLVSVLNNGQAGLAITAGCLAAALVYMVTRRRQRVRLTQTAMRERPAQPAGTP
jgi:MFS family permease